MSDFYRYTLNDFEEVTIADLQDGEELAWGIGSDKFYGSAAIASIDKIPDGYVIDMLLPIGANVTSTENRQISVKWDGDIPRISITEYHWCDANEPMLRRKREGEDNV